MMTRVNSPIFTSSPYIIYDLKKMFTKTSIIEIAIFRKIAKILCLISQEKFPADEDKTELP